MTASPYRHRTARERRAQAAAAAAVARARTHVPPPPSTEDDKAPYPITPTIARQIRLSIQEDTRRDEQP